MSNLKILLKNNFNLLLGRLQGKRKRKSTGVAILLLVLGMIGIFAYTLCKLGLCLKALAAWDLANFACFME